MMRIIAVLLLAAWARADETSIPQLPSVTPAGPQAAAPTVSPVAVPQAAPSVLVPLPVAQALENHAQAVPQATVPTAAEKPTALTELKEGSSVTKPGAAQAPAVLGHRYDGSDAKPRTLEQEIAETPVSHNVGVMTFSMRVRGETAFLQYRMRQGRLIILHTEVPTSLEGRGVGGKIVKAALEYAKEKGLRVNPLCPFAAHYVDRHPEYQPLLSASEGS